MNSLDIPVGYVATGGLRVPKDGGWLYSHQLGRAVQASSEVLLTQRYVVLSKV